jgi:hypothetical protein
VIKLSAFNIKILAALFMLMDHVCYVLVPNLLILHYFGRLSFPLFAWLLAEGAKHTRNAYRYGSRLLIAAIITQPIYTVVFKSSSLNILFTLLIGLVMLRLVRRYPRLAQQISIVGLCAVVAEISGSKSGRFTGAYFILLHSSHLSILLLKIWQFLQESLFFYLMVNKGQELDGFIYSIQGIY